MREQARDLFKKTQDLAQQVEQACASASSTIGQQIQEIGHES